MSERVERPDPAPAPPEQPAWVALKDDELLQKRICDLGAKIPGSELEGRVAQLYDELAARGLAFRPACYLGDEWFSPEGVPAIAIPFYLAHPRLKALELHQMLEVEGGTPEWCLQLLRHESGHAIDHAYHFSSREDWRALFGNPEAEYAPETYQPRPYSRGFVRNLPNWYAQAHPDEDFAETFAVWLQSTPEQWREQYRGWKALEKTRVRALSDGRGEERKRRSSSADGAFMKPASCEKRWRDTTPSGANSTRRIFRTFTMRICALYSEVESRTGNLLRKLCAQIAPGAGRLDCPLDRTAQVHGGHAGAQVDPSAASSCN